MCIRDSVGTDGQKWIATQLVVWEFCTGYRDASTFTLSNSKFIDGITSVSYTHLEVNIFSVEKSADVLCRRTESVICCNACLLYTSRCV